MWKKGDARCCVVNAYEVCWGVRSIAVVLDGWVGRMLSGQLHPEMALVVEAGVSGILELHTRAARHHFVEYWLLRGFLAEHRDL